MLVLSIMYLGNGCVAWTDMVITVKSASFFREKFRPFVTKSGLSGSKFRRPRGCMMPVFVLCAANSVGCNLGTTFSQELNLVCM